MDTLDTFGALHEHESQARGVLRHLRALGGWQLRPPVMKPGICGRRLD